MMIERRPAASTVPFTTSSSGAPARDSMKLLFCLSILLPLFFLAEVSHGDFTGKGHVHVLSETKQVFVNDDCRRTDSCDLKSFALIRTAYEVWFSDDPYHPTYGSGAIMEYETESVSALEKYAVVQFKKGCVFYSSEDREGKIRRVVNDTVLSFGSDTSFCFPRWVIDSQDTDPAYNSDPEYGRFYLLRWNRPGSYEQRTQELYGAEKPKKPVLYMTDYPAGAFVTGAAARNVALEFNSCIFKADEVPAATRRNDVRFARPIHCFDWRSIYVYDFAAGKFRTQLAGLPWWEVPPLVVDVHLLLTFAALLIALALVIISRLRDWLGQ